MKLRKLRLILYIIVLLLVLISVFSLYKNSYLIIWATLLGPIIGVIVSSIMALEIRRMRLQDRYVKKHLEDIKLQYVKPLKDVLSSKLLYFEFGGNTIDIVPLENILKLHEPWYNKKSIDGNMSIGLFDQKFYDDLKSHAITKNLNKEFESIKNTLSNNYPVFLKNKIKLYKNIEDGSEFNDLKKKYTNQILNKNSSLPREANIDYQIDQKCKSFCYAIFLVAVGYGKELRQWPDIYKSIIDEGVINDVYYIGEKYSNSIEAKEMKEAKANVVKIMSPTISRLEYIINNVFTLEENCPFIKEIMKSY